MSQLFAIFHHAPWYVSALFVVLVLLGTQALRDRTISLRRVLITPVIFIGWGLIAVAGQSVSSPLFVTVWLIAATMGTALAVMTARFDRVRFEPARQMVSLPRSTVPLARNLLIFTAKYAIGVALALAPTAHVPLAIVDIAISGASAGYFFGWVARLMAAYRRTAAPDPADPSTGPILELTAG